MTLILSLSLLVFLFVGTPLAFTLGISALAALIAQGDVPLAVVTQRMFVAVDSFSLLAIPFFILAGELMNAAGSPSAWSTSRTNWSATSWAASPTWWWSPT